MRAMLIGTAALVAACVAIGEACTPEAVCATNIPAHGYVKPHVLRQLKPQTPSKGHHIGPHHIFGTITAIDTTGNILSVKRRNGSLISVDASTAIGNNDYSYPLFVGKTVAVDGVFGATHATFNAVHVDAISTLQSLEADQ